MTDDAVPSAVNSAIALFVGHGMHLRENARIERGHHASARIGDSYPVRRDTYGVPAGLPHVIDSLTLPPRSSSTGDRGSPAACGLSVTSAARGPCIMSATVPWAKDCGVASVSAARMAPGRTRLTKRTTLLQ